jgi:hypothetical protein
MEVWRGNLNKLPKELEGSISLPHINRVIRPLSNVNYAFMLINSEGVQVQCCDSCMSKAVSGTGEPIVHKALKLQPEGALQAKVEYKSIITCNGEKNHVSKKEFKVILKLE